MEELCARGCRGLVGSCFGCPLVVEVVSVLLVDRVVDAFVVPLVVEAVDLPPVVVGVGCAVWCRRRYARASPPLRTLDPCRVQAGSERSCPPCQLGPWMHLLHLGPSLVDVILLDDPQVPEVGVGITIVPWVVGSTSSSSHLLLGNSTPHGAKMQLDMLEGG